MRDSKRTVRRTLRAAATSALLVLCASAAGAAQDASSTYRGTPRDPFARYKPPVRRKVEAKKAMPVTPPDVEARIENYKAQKVAAMNSQRPAPKPTTALLLSELQVTGIFRTPRGYAAMVEATPIKLSYVVYPGEPFYDGMLVAIEETRLVFRRQTRWTDGRVEVAVETKPLRQPSAGDALTVTRGESAEAGQGSGDAAARPAGAKDEASALLDLLKAIAAGQRQPGPAAGTVVREADPEPDEPVPGSRATNVTKEAREAARQCTNGATFLKGGKVVCR